MVNRNSNLDFMARRDMTAGEIEVILSSLTCEDYHRGPEADHSGAPGEIWVFLYRSEKPMQTWICTGSVLRSSLMSVSGVQLKSWRGGQEPVGP